MLYLTLIVAVLMVLPGTMGLINTKINRSSATFFALSAWLSAWIITNYFADADLDRSLFWTRLTFFSIVWAAFFFLIFVYNFPKRHKSTALLYAIPIPFVVSTLLFTPLVVKSVDIIEGTSNVVYGPLYVIFLVYFISTVLLIVRRLTKNYRIYHGKAKSQISDIFRALVLMVTLGSLFNLLLPLLMGSNQYARYGTYSTLLFVGIISYSMFKKGLFDIRAAVARATAYILSLLVLVILYFVLVDRDAA